MYPPFRCHVTKYFTYDGWMLSETSNHKHRKRTRGQGRHISSMFPRSVVRCVSAPVTRSSSVRCSTAARASDALRPAGLADECPEESLTSAVTKPRPFKDMPGPRALPLVGTRWMRYPGGPLYGLTRRDQHARLREMYGDVIKENIVPGILTLVHVFNPRDIESIFRQEGKYPIRQAFFMLKRFNEKYNDNVSGIISSQGIDWYNVRSQVQKKITNPRFVTSHINSQQRVADDFIEWIRNRRDEDDIIEDILPYLYRYATEAIGVVCFSRRVGALDDTLEVESEAHEFTMAVSDMMTATASEVDSWFLFLYFDTPLFKRFKKAQETVKRISLEYAQQLLEETTDVESEHDVDQGKLIPYLLKETSLSEAHVLTIVSECFFAGVDTTSHCLGFTLYNLCKHPEAMERLVTEINEHLPDHSPVSSETLGKMSYLRAVIKESLRLNPILAGNGRTNSTELVLSGYTVPAGMYLGLHTDLTAQQDDLLDDAQSFRPERWLRNNLHLKPKPFTYLPFGFGKRSCPGKRLAEQEVSIALIKILQNFEVTYRHEVDMEYEVRILNTPLTPLKFSFTDLK